MYLRINYNLIIIEELIIIKTDCVRQSSQIFKKLKIKAKDMFINLLKKKKYRTNTIEI